MKQDLRKCHLDMGSVSTTSLIHGGRGVRLTPGSREEHSSLCSSLLPGVSLTPRQVESLGIDIHSIKELIN
ncbi:hypothetical protein CesoFtcFv8_027724 [Champsocephalus esox]|uniref:Uncharacterized protein n=1 Tax=Champsocephalus esox TaxID=159716 RepID=A0AAN8AYW4_9TELE|nr:hypothetical protein CesoFtcFv8_027724 [Champsocephalus esox]